jgi:hypothetical protein
VRSSQLQLWLIDRKTVQTGLSHLLRVVHEIPLSHPHPPNIKVTARGRLLEGKKHPNIPTLNKT